MAFFPFIKNAAVTVDGAAASDEVKSVKFDPTVTTATFAAISGKTVNDANVTGWNCTIEYAQDWETANSFSHLLHAASGGDTVLTFSPKGTTSLWTVTVGLLPGSIGGAAGAAEGTVTLPCRAKPAWTVGI